MKNIFGRLLVFFILVSCLFLSCSNGLVNIPSPSEEKDDLLTYMFYCPKTSPYTVFWDDFEGNSITSKNPWVSNGASPSSYEKVRNYLVTNNPEKVSYYSTLLKGNDSSIVEISCKAFKTSSLTINNLDVKEKSILSFRYFFSGYTEASFKVILDGTKEGFITYGLNSSACFSVKTVSIEVPAGTKSIQFAVTNPSGYSYEKWPNAAYIDDVSLVYDRTADIKIFPRSAQKTYLGCPQDEKIQCKAYAIRADGTVLKDKKVSVSVNNGSIDSNGYYTPSNSGTVQIKGTCDGITGYSGEIKVFVDNNNQNPIEIGGTTYNGLISDNGASLSKSVVDLEYPRTNKITADGYVRIKGKLSQDYVSRGYDKVYVKVPFGDSYTIYMLDKEFDERIWLPFTGEKAIEMYPAKANYFTYVDKNGNQCEGDLRSYSYSNSSLKIMVTNTHVHSAVKDGESDGRFVYPSFECQSDSFVVQNYTNEALFGLGENATNAQKFKAIHDYIILNNCYDYDSIGSNQMRKKQDAVSVIYNKTCVCEGYSTLTTAMSRYAGIPAKIQSSKNLNHAWNHIYVNGYWYFCDVTWDDPDKSPSSKRIEYDYYLLNSYTGINNDHVNKEDDQTTDYRSAILFTDYDELSVFLKQGYEF